MAPTNQPRPGFDTWFSFTGQGVYEDPVVNENGREFQAQGYMTDILNRRALEFLDQRHDEQPFCLVLSHKAVHEPFTPPPRHEGLYDGVEYPEPPNFQDDFAGKPAWLRRHLGQRVYASRVQEHRVPDTIPPAPWNPVDERRMDYYRAISAVDEGVGQILDRLEAGGRLENTLVVFAGDNGFFWGEHRRGDKRLMYEESIRIPLLAHCPALIRSGTTIPELVLNIDLAPTFLDLAGVPVPEHMQGRSWRPLFSGRTGEWRRSFLYEYWRDLTPAIPAMVGVRTADHKLVRYPEIQDLDELYDLEADPHELRNLAADPAFRAHHQRLQAELERLMRETGLRYQDMSSASEHMLNNGDCVLAYSFDRVEGDRVVDQSGMGHDGQLVSGTTAPGPEGLPVLVCDGDALITVPRADTLSPGRSCWTVMVRARVDGDGVILAQGGESRGYTLFVEDGRVCFGYRQVLFVADTAQPTPTGTWQTITATVTPNRVVLAIDGGEPVALSYFRPIQANPNDVLSIGRDSGSPVDAVTSGQGFRGQIAWVRMYDGVVEQIGL
jgi:N-acetylglucosamine-6-sulfatase